MYGNSHTLGVNSFFRSFFSRRSRQRTVPLHEISGKNAGFWTASIRFCAGIGTVNRFRLVAADVSRLKFPPLKNERTHVRCYEFHRETTGILAQDQDSRSAAAGKNRRQRKIAVLHNAVSTSYVVS